MKVAHYKSVLTKKYESVHSAPTVTGNPNATDDTHD